MKYLKYLGLFLGLFFISWVAQAQHEPSEEDMKRIESMKIGYITKSLNLTTEEAQKFWPIYNEYNDAQKNIRKQLHQLRKSKPFEKSESEMKKMLEKALDLKQQQLDVEKKYLNKFLEVISAKKVGALRHAEREFRHQMFRELHQRGKRKFKGEHGNH